MAELFRFVNPDLIILARYMQVVPSELCAEFAGRKVEMVDGGGGFGADSRSFEMPGTRGLAKLAGTLHFSDLERLPRVSHTFLLQCGAANPRGIVKWTGVRFADFADTLGLVPGAHYCRLVASDRAYVDEPLATLRHPQVMLAWLMNDAPIPPKHGAPLRLIVPFRYGQRSIKAITELVFATPGLPMPPLPA